MTRVIDGGCTFSCSASSPGVMAWCTSRADKAASWVSDSTASVSPEAARWARRRRASRLTAIRTVGGVTFVDDSLSTNVLPTLAALDAFEGRRVALIVGGHDRGIDYAPLAAGLVARAAPTLALTIPESGPRIRAQLEQAAANGKSTPAFAGARDCPDLEAAVAAGFRWAQPEGVVLLSPAAPSFGRFRDYRDRSDAFAHAVCAIS